LPPPLGQTHPTSADGREMVCSNGRVSRSLQNRRLATLAGCKWRTKVRANTHSRTVQIQAMEKVVLTPWPNKTHVS
jgi:hypothetical protein